MAQQGSLPPGFRFSPTDEELVAYYLKNKVCGKSFHNGVITDLDIYKHEPWELSKMSVLDSKDPVWYFFNARDQRHSRTARINRTTSKGYWKATGKDRKVCTGSQTVGVKKTLIYYEGRAPTGIRTDWLMHEYKLIEDVEKKGENGFAPTLCRIRKKSGPGPRNGEQYGAPVTSDDCETEQVFGIVTEEVEEKLLETKDNEDRSTTLEGLSEGYGNCRSIEYDERMEAITHFLLSEDAKTNDGSTLYRDNTIIPYMDSTVGGSLIDFDDSHIHEFLHPDVYEPGMLGVLGHDDSGIGVSDEMNGDFIEMFDINSPLSRFAPSSPLGSFGQFESQALSNYYENDGSLAEGVLSLPRSDNTMLAQGLAPRRIMLQLPMVSNGRTKDENNVLNETVSVLVKPELEEDAGRKPPYFHDQNLVDPSSGGCKNKSFTTSFISKHQSNHTVSIHGEAPPQVYYSLKEDSVAANDNDPTSLIDETDKMTAMFRSCAINEDYIGVDGESCEIDGVSYRIHREANGFNEESHRINRESDGFNKESTSEDCEANLLAHLHSEGSRTKHFKNAWRSKLATFISKAKSSSICTGLKRIEDRVNSRFNERVSRYGKRASQFFSANDHYVNPYDLMRKGVMSLLYLVGAVLVILLAYLGFHIIANLIFI